MNAIVRPARPPPVHTDKPELLDRVTRVLADGRREVELHVADMRCANCGERIRAALRNVAGVHEVRLDPARRLAVVTYEPARAALAGVLAGIERVGYTPAFAGIEPDDPTMRAAHRRDLKRLGVAGIAMMQTMMFAVGSYAGAFEGMTPFWADLMRWSGFVFALPVVVYSARPFFVNATASLREWIGAPTDRPGLAMDVPVALAIAIAFVASVHATVVGSGDVYFDSVTMFTFFLLGARYLERGALHLAARFDPWLSLLPGSASRIGPDGIEFVPLARIQTADRLIVEPGSRIPCDGVVGDGDARIDESALTGESAPIVKTNRAAVFAGTLNIGDAFTMTVADRRVATRMAAIQHLATRATLERPPFVTLADRIARGFVLALLLLATATAAAWSLVDPGHALAATIAVLVVSCPCALSLATPAAIAAATVTLRRHGFVLTRPDVLERLSRADTVVFDKTGTLTSGCPELVATNAKGGLPAPQCLAVAAALEQAAEHPLQRAFVVAAAGMEIPVACDVHVHRSNGIEGSIGGCRYRLGHAAFCGVAPAGGTADTCVHLAAGGVELAEFRLRDDVRRDARAAIDALKRLGLRVEALSGDTAGPCASVGAALGISVRARTSPEAKLEHVRRLAQEGRSVVMVGDGINDVPGLAAATVAVAPADATELACGASDALLLSRGILPLVDAFVVARRTRRIVAQNLVWAFGYNLLCIPLAAIGAMPPWVAALGMSTSSLLVTLNALRLSRAPADRAPERVWKS